MTIWALALLAAFSQATVVPAKTGGRAAPVVVVPAVAPVLGGGAAGASLGNLDLRGSFPALPAPVPGLTAGIPAANFVPPGAMSFKKIDAQSASAAPQEAPRAAPEAAPSPAAPRRQNGIMPEGPAVGVLVPGALPAQSVLMPALGARGEMLAPSAPLGEEAAAAAGRGLFDASASRSALDVSRFGVPLRPSTESRGALLPRSADGSVSRRERADVPAAFSSLDTPYMPDAAPVAGLIPVPGGSVDVAMRDAVASPSLRVADPLSAGLRGGHTPLLARPSRLALAGEGLVLRVTPAPGADSLMRGRPSWTATAAPVVPAAKPGPAAGIARLVSTELIERGALLEAVSASDAAIGRGLLGLPDGDMPGAMSGSLKLKSATRPPSAPAPVSPVGKTLPFLGLSLLPLAAYAALRRFL